MRLMNAALACLVAASAFAASPGTPVNYSNDISSDFEPTITRAYNATTTVTVTAAIKEITLTNLRTQYTVKDGAQTFQGFLPSPADYPWSVDPYLYPNQYATAIAPYRLYCSGIVSNGNAFTNAITVWRDDNLGRNGFPNYTIIEQGGERIILDATFYEERTLDKPTMVVNGNSSHRGNVYVAWMRRSTIRQRSNNVFVKQFFSIYVSRSTDGGVTFETPVRIWSNENDAQRPRVNSAHVVTANGNGYVYVTWAIYDGVNSKIMLARSPSAGAISGGAWVVDATGPTGNFRLSTPSNGMQSMTVPVTRYNWVKNKLMVTWNELEASGTKSDVFYAEKGGSGWSTWNGSKKLKLNNESAACPTITADQLRPALDFDSTGKVTVAWYDRQVDCANNDRYDVFFTQLTTGTSTPATVSQAPTRMNNFTSDVSENTNRIGEYFDVWCETSTCYTAWIGTPNAQGDVFVTPIQ